MRDVRVWREWEVGGKSWGLGGDGCWTGVERESAVLLGSFCLVKGV